MLLPLKHYEKVYVSKVFGDEYSQMIDFTPNADEVVYGGTGFAISISDFLHVVAAIIVDFASSARKKDFVVNKLPIYLSSGMDRL